MATSTDIATWRSEAIQALLATQLADGGWPYQRRNTTAVTEATAWAVMALSAEGDTSGAIDAGLGWLLDRQREDGFFTASDLLTERSWMTSPAGLALVETGQDAEAAVAGDALLGAEVFTLLFPRPGIYGYNTGIAGWPWTDGDFSFIEPTSMAVLFLKAIGQGDHGRTREAISVIRDRALEVGGWNYGEPAVLQGDLFPTTIPTAAVLLAMQDEQDDAIAAGTGFLQAQQGTISTLLSLGWATMALNVYGLLTEAWCADVVELWNSLPEARRDPLGTALCILGVTETPEHPLTLS